MTKSKYREYLRSDHWHAMRARVWQRSEGRCEYRFLGIRRCRARAVDVHHRTYARLGHESMRDLIHLCVRHHRQAHRIRRGR
jgi:hypothetical protein